MIWVLALVLLLLVGGVAVAGFTTLGQTLQDSGEFVGPAGRADVTVTPT